MLRYMHVILSHKHRQGNLISGNQSHKLTLEYQYSMLSSSHFPGIIKFTDLGNTVTSTKLFFVNCNLYFQ